MMARLVDQAQTIGLSLEQYLKAQNKTADELREGFTQMAENTIKGEFILGKLVKDKNIEVDDSEVENTFKAAGYENIEERMANPMETVYVKSVLQKNKLISDIIDEIEGEFYDGKEQKSK